MAEICGVLLAALLLNLIWIPSGLSQQDLEKSPDDAEENEGFGGTFSLKHFKSWMDGHKIELMNYVVQLNQSVNIKSPIEPAPKGLHWFSLNMEKELPPATRRKPGLAYSHYFDKFLKTYNKSWARAFTFSKRNRFLNITQVNLGYADMFRLHVDDYEKDNENKSDDFDVAITLMTYSSHECGFKGMPQNAKLGDLFILSCRVTVNGLWNTSLVFRNVYDNSEIRGEVSKCGPQPSVGSRICSTVRVNANANILAYTCNLEFSADLREDPKHAMFQKSKWTTRFNREVVCFLPRVYLETIPVDVSFQCNHMPCEETVEVNDYIRCSGYGYPQPDFDLRITLDNSSDKELMRQMFEHVEKIQAYAHKHGTIKTIKSVSKEVPGSEEDRSINDEESDERRAQLMEEVAALTQQFMDEYGPNMDQEKLKELYDSIIQNYTFPNLEYKSQVFMDSDEEEEEDTTIPVGTAEAFSDGDEPSFTRFTDRGIEEKEMTIGRTSDEEEEDTAIPVGTAQTFSDGDEPSFIQITDDGVWEQQMTTKWNSVDRDGYTTEEEEDAAIPVGTAEAFSDGDEPSFTRFTDGGIEEKEMTIGQTSDDRGGDTTEEEEDAAIRVGTAQTFSDGDEPSFTQITDDGIWEQQMTTEWNSGTVSEDDEMRTQAPESAEKDPAGFKDYQFQQTDVGHIEVSCNVSNALGWGYIVMSLQVLSSTQKTKPDTTDPTRSAVTVEEETDEPDEETDEPDVEPDEYTREYTVESELSMMPTTEMEQSEVTDEYMTSARYPVWENDGTQEIFEPTEDARRGTESDRVDEDLETTPEDARRGTATMDSFSVDEDFKTAPKVHAGAPTVVEAGEAAGGIDNKEKTEEAEEAAGNIARQLAGDVTTGEGPVTPLPGGQSTGTKKTGAADHNVQSVVLELFLLICGVCLTRIEL